MGIFLLKDVVIIFGLSIVVLLLCHRLRIPSIVGFIFTGILSGPHGLGLIHEIDAVDNLSNLGIMLLLFTVGMEMSLKKIVQFKRFFLYGGLLQVALTVLAGFAIGTFLNRPPGEAVFLGFLLSLSSTAIVLRIFEERNETHSPQGQMVLGILIFQDVVAIPMMLMAPVLGGVADTSLDTFFFWLLLKGILLLAIVFIASQKFIPKLLFVITQTRSRELFLMTVLTLCFATAYLAYALGLSLTIGAFLAGLILAESEYSNEAVGDVLPIQDIFTSFFFVSIGMLLDLAFVVAQPITLALSAIGILLLKTFTGAASGLLVGMPLRTALLGGIALSQIGEFSFVLAKVGIDYNLGMDYYYQFFLAVALFTMGLAPVAIGLSAKIAHYALTLPFPDKLKGGFSPMKSHKEKGHTGHVIIAGYGVSGQNLAHSLREAQIPYVILELNPDTVQRERLKGEPIYFGDAAHIHVLNHVNVEEARGVAVLINDPKASYRIVENVRKVNSNVYTVVRVRFLQEMEPMYKLGADDVIPDEFCASVEIFTRVLRQFKVQQKDVENYVASMRFEGYDIIRYLCREPTALSNTKFSFEDMKIETYAIQKGAPIEGKTLGDVGLRKNFGVTVIMIKRGKDRFFNLDATSEILAQDDIVVVGSHENLIKAFELFNPQKSNETSVTNNLAESRN